MRTVPILFILTCVAASFPPPARAQAPGATEAPSPQHLAFFETRIRPVLAEHCYECHSARATKLKANLRLDSRAALLAGGDSGPAIVPGDPDHSRLVHAVRYTDDDLQMPPKRKLPDAVVSDLAAWVKLGAPWPDEPPPSVAAVKPADEKGEAAFDKLRREHWSFKPLTRPAVPAVKDASWARTEVDQYFLSALEAKGLEPAPPADRLTLVRRAYFDLLGLPPTPEEVDAFVNDPAADEPAFAALVDKLLASPHFGERWGRHWLDVARYADSTGGGRSAIFEDAWRYRDYVIDSFNRDKPYDAFVAEQIAGDLIPAPDPAQARQRLVATGFLALGPKNLDAQDKETLRMDVVDEQLDTIGRAVLGLSLGCARCHDHKFDPVTTREYYALAGILRSTKTLLPGNVSGFVRRPLPGLDEHADRCAEHDKRTKELQKQLDTARAELKKLSPALAATVKAGGTRDPSSLTGVVVDDSAAKSTGEWKSSTFHPSYVGTGYLHDDNRGKGEKSVEFNADLPSGGEYEVRLSYTPGDTRATSVPVLIRYAAGGEATVHVDQRKAPPIDGLFVSLGTFRFDAGSGAASVTVSNDGTKGHVIVDAVQFVPVGAASAVAKSPSQPPPEGSASDKGKVEEVAQRVKRLEAELASVKKTAPPPPPMAVSVQEEEKAEDFRVCVRGNVHNPGPAVPRGFLLLATVGEPPKVSASQSGRRELADWLTRPDNPLTARVYVNRVWQHLFGAGIVRTPDDFGVTGEPPSHPELLDRLATTFIEDGWSTKKLIRRLMLSRAYVMSSPTAGLPASAGSAPDPENRLLSRMNRRRLDAEALRDAVLRVSGRLDLSKVGGPSVRAGASEFGYDFDEDAKDLLRRSVYLPVLRYSPHEMLEVFDFPDANLVSGRRSTSTLATQALFLMNSPFMTTQSRHAADALLADKSVEPAVEARLDAAYRRALARPPTDREREIANKFLGPTPTRDQWASLFQTLFATLDFRYVN